MSDIAFQSATQLAAAIKAKKIGALELLDLYLDRVERHNPTLNCYVALDAEGARERARQADEATAKGQSWGPLHGVPTSLKESYNYPGLPTTWGVPALRDNIATEPALAARRLMDAGAVIFGKTNVPLTLGDWQSYNEIYGTTNNPWDLGRSPGGSSGGTAAALAAGLTGLDAGSDIGGSIRNPAHFCGVYGHKPTWNLLPPRGHAMGPTVAPTDLSVIGPLARSAEDLALALGVMAGPNELDANGYQLDLAPPRATRLGDFRVAVWADDPLAPVDAAVADHIETVAQLLEKAGAKVDRAARPDYDTAAAHQTYLTLLFGIVTAREPAEAFEQARHDVAALADDDRSIQAMTTRGRVLHYRDWLGANEFRTQVRWAWHRFFGDHDVVIAPISTTPAFKHDHEPDQTKRTLPVNGAQGAYLDNLYWAGLVTAPLLPATAAPVGFSDGLPVGVQIIGDHLNDRTTIEFARLLTRETGGFVAPKGYD
ncbi:MAG: amidase [Alphaproteobacteria bacterium]